MIIYIAVFLLINIIFTNAKGLMHLYLYGRFSERLVREFFLKPTRNGL